MSGQEVVLVCAPADFPITIAGATFDQVCAECGAALMLAPTGQQFVREHPDTRLLCLLCVDLDAIDSIALTAPAERIANERKGIQPNLRRGRN